MCLLLKASITICVRRSLIIACLSRSMGFTTLYDDSILLGYALSNPAH